MNKSAPVIPTEAEWSVRMVGEMTTLLRRGTAPVYVDESDVMAIGQRCVTDVDFDGSRSRPHSAIAMSKVVTPEVGDVLVNSTGTGTIGRSVIFNDKTAKYIVDGHVTVARPRPTDVVGRWLNDVLRSPAGQRYLESRCYAGSTNQVELSLSALATMPIAVPEVAEQQRVAKVLDTLDDQLNLTEQILNKLRQTKLTLATTFFADLQQGKVEPLGKYLLRIEAGWSPECPEVVPEEGQWGVLKVSAVSGFSYRPAESKVLPPNLAPKVALQVKKGDVLCARANGVGELVGRAVYVESTPPCLMLSDKTLRLVPTARLDGYFMVLALGSHEARKFIESRMGGSSSQKNISQAELMRLPVVVPDLSVQLKLVAEARSIDRSIDRSERMLSKLRILKGGLVADLLTGRVRVPGGA